MESEKIKEIKRILESFVTCSNRRGGTIVLNYNGKNLQADVLTLINELESENERLSKEIEENAFYSKGYAQGIKNTYEVVVPDKLTQFAERLKEMAYKSTDWSHGEHPMVVEVDYIDETLEEFIK